jgi:hypothetical protein
MNRAKRTAMDSALDMYEAYMADLRDWIEVDRETRLLVLDTAAGLEMEIYAIVALYLGGGDVNRRDLVERHVATWGPISRLLDLLKDALRTHGQTSDGAAINALFDTRHLIAHGRVETWHANDPELRDGDLGRQIYKRSRTGNTDWGVALL